MEKINLAIIFLVLAIIFIYFLKPKITGFFIGFGEPTNATWWNTTWHYRIRIDVYSPTERTNWPIEIKLKPIIIIARYFSPSFEIKKNKMEIGRRMKNPEIPRRNILIL